MIKRPRMLKSTFHSGHSTQPEIMSLYRLNRALLSIPIFRLNNDRECKATVSGIHPAFSGVRNTPHSHMWQHKLVTLTSLHTVTDSLNYWPGVQMTMRTFCFGNLGFFCQLKTLSRAMQLRICPGGRIPPRSQQLSWHFLTLKILERVGCRLCTIAKVAKAIFLLFPSDVVLQRLPIDNNIRSCRCFL